LPGRQNTNRSRTTALRALGAPVQNFAALFYSSLAEGRHGCEISNIGMVSLPKLWAFQ